MTLDLAPLRAGTPDFDARVEQLLNRAESSVSATVMAAARSIVDAVRSGGDAALLAAVAEYDAAPGQGPQSASHLRLDVLTERPRTASEVSDDFKRAVEQSIDAVTRWHQAQRTWIDAGAVTHSSAGVEITERMVPINRVGLYVPGGRFVYPSSVIMSVVPAQVAGVSEVVVATPPTALDSSAELRYVLSELGVDEVWGIGGAHAIAALAYGTQTIRPVDTIAGPGNAWVTAAKQLVRGQVGIDQDAGPSEVVIIASGDAPADWVAADLIAQAEHDPAAVAVLLTPSEELANAVVGELAEQLATLATAETARASLVRFGAPLVTRDLEQALTLGERLAAEHQQLMGAEAEALAPRCVNAGAVFVGNGTPTCFGDYAVGPSHVLPTGGSARYSSGLSVLNFVRRSHLVKVSSEAADRMSVTASALARVEGLVGHARSAELRSAGTSTTEVVRHE